MRCRISLKELPLYISGDSDIHYLTGEITYINLLYCIKCLINEQHLHRHYTLLHIYDPIPREVVVMHSEYNATEKTTNANNFFAVYRTFPSYVILCNLEMKVQS